MDIYQKIWNADQAQNGIAPILKLSDGDPQVGYVLVNEAPTGDPNQRLFAKVVIPDSKRATYNLVRKLFNNYALDQGAPEIDTPEENQETHELIKAVIETEPMVVARKWLEEQTGEQYNEPRWYKTVFDAWFTKFTQSSGRDLSAFEHIVVGEQSGGKVSGYHFWYKYYLDDSHDLLGGDTIQYLGLKGQNQEENLAVPEVSTLSYKWDAFDYDAGEYRPLFKKIGGFFNGCSIEGLLALGTVRFVGAGRAPKEALINGSTYAMKMFRSQDGRHMRTFYPQFIERVGGGGNGTVDVPPEVVVIDPTLPSSSAVVPNDVRLIAALVNPQGHDPGFESVTLINTSDSVVSIDGWEIVDNNGNAFTVKNREIAPGETLRIYLPEQTAQLTNKGGTIKLTDRQGNTVHAVRYSKQQARAQGRTLVF